MPFLKEEKSEHERARTPMLAVQPCCARHCELPLSKMGNKGLFPGRVSEANQGRGQPRRGYRRPKPATHSGAGRKSRRAACFLWYFLSRRKKVRSPVGAAAPPSAPESARQAPGKTFLQLRGLTLRLQMTFRVANNRHPASFPQIYRFALLLLNWAIIRNFFSLALI